VDSQNKYRQLSQMADVIHSYKGTKVLIQISPGWGRQGHPNENGIASDVPSAVPLTIDMRNISKGWFRQINRIIKQAGISVPVEVWDYDKIKSLSDDEYEAIKPLIFKLFEEKAPEYYHIICGQTPRER
jgi:hypothetical protein